VPGHEIVGRVTAVGVGVKKFKVGDTVGVGCLVDSCRTCPNCQAGLEQFCDNGMVMTYGSIDKHLGIPTLGGYSQSIVVTEDFVLRMPANLNPAAAAPLLCAGITTYNALRHSGAHAGDRVAILGVGGLGHLGVQFAAKLGFDTVAIARGTAKEELARKLGARHYIDSTAQDPAAELQALGGARVVLATVTNAPAMTAVLGGLGVRGKLLVVGASMEPMQIPPAMLIGGSKAIVGHASGHSGDSEDTLDFSALSGVRPMIETYPLEQAEAAYDRMMSGEARFRMVLTTVA
jgi:D-arabinose 1-dehydrogenase-like Zn-dependent alcohol dehydrogenase